MPYGVPDALQEIIKAKEGYVAATGTLRFDESKLPKVDWDRQEQVPPTTNIRARLEGMTLTKSGFTHPIDTPITFEVHCFGPWCAGGVSGKPVLAFLKQTSNGYVLSTDPCGGHVFYEPSKETLESVVQCYTKGRCPKSVNH